MRLPLCWCCSCIEDICQCTAPMRRKVPAPPTRSHLLQSGVIVHLPVGKIPTGLTFQQCTALYICPLISNEVVSRTDEYRHPHWMWRARDACFRLFERKMCLGQRRQHSLSGRCRPRPKMKYEDSRVPRFRCTLENIRWSTTIRSNPLRRQHKPLYSFPMLNRTM